jgi:hypothetical protein
VKVSCGLSESQSELAIMGQATVDSSFALDLGVPKVQHLHNSAVSLLRDHQVAGLDVAVDHSQLAGTLQPQGSLMIDRPHAAVAELADHLIVLVVGRDGASRTAAVPFDLRDG